MKLFRVYNGFIGESAVRVDAIAESAERAIEIARPVFLRDRNEPRYVANLEAICIFDDCDIERVSELSDG